MMKSKFQHVKNQRFLNMNKLSIIVPAYNEEKYIYYSLKRLDYIDYSIPLEIIVVNDGSIDNTLEMAFKAKRETRNNIIIIHKKKNQGKGAAIKAALKVASGNIIAIHDADLEYNPKDLKIMLKLLLKLGNKYSIYGSRLLEKNRWLNFKQKTGNVILSMITTLVYQSRITDMETCYKMFYKSTLNKTIKAKSFNVEPEITSIILNNKIKIKEIPIRYHPRGYNKGKKIKYRDGIEAIKTLLKYKFFN